MQNSLWKSKIKPSTNNRASRLECSTYDLSYIVQGANTDDSEVELSGCQMRVECHASFASTFEISFFFDNQLKQPPKIPPQALG